MKLFVALVVAGCAPAPADPWAHWESDGTRGCFPTPPKVSETNEGPFARALIAASHDRGSRYEVARFRLPRPLTAAQREMLLGRVEQGLLHRPDATSAETGTMLVSGQVARALSVRLAKEKRGRWLIFFTTPAEMLEVSVVGPAADSERAWRFLSSFGAEHCD